MSITAQTWQQLCQDITIATQDIFTQINTDSRNANYKSDGSLVTETDLQLQQCIKTCLIARCPHIPLLGEEMDEAEQIAVLATGSCWILDPLDGTSNFSHGIPFFSVSLALMHQKEIIAGMVYDPNRDELFSAFDTQEAMCNGITLTSLIKRNDTTDLKRAIAVIDTKRLSRNLACAIVTQHPYHSQRSFGSVALDWCWLAAGRIDTYLHGKQKLWDFAAAAFIAQKMGCCTQTLTGENILALPLNLMPRSAVGAQPQLASAWTQWVAEHQEEPN